MLYTLPMVILPVSGSDPPEFLLFGQLLLAYLLLGYLSVRTV